MKRLFIWSLLEVINCSSSDGKIGITLEGKEKLVNEFISFLNPADVGNFAQIDKHHRDRYQPILVEDWYRFLHDESYRESIRAQPDFKHRVVFKPVSESFLETPTILDEYILSKKQIYLKTVSILYLRANPQLFHEVKSFAIEVSQPTDLSILLAFDNLRKVTIKDQAIRSFCLNQEEFQDQAKAVNAELKFHISLQNPTSYREYLPMFRCLEDSHLKYSLSIGARDLRYSVHFSFLQYIPNVSGLEIIADSGFVPQVADLVNLESFRIYTEHEDYQALIPLLPQTVRNLELATRDYVETPLDFSGAQFRGLQRITFTNVNVNLQTLAGFDSLHTLKLDSYESEGPNLAPLLENTSIVKVIFSPASEETHLRLLPFLLRIPNLQNLIVYKYHYQSIPDDEWTQADDLPDVYTSDNKEEAKVNNPLIIP